MSYRLINANALNGVISNDDYEKVLDMPCIYADLPNGLDGNHYNLQKPTPKESLAVEDNIAREDVEKLPRYKFHDEDGNVVLETIDIKEIRALPSVLPKAQEPSIDELRAEITALQHRCYSLTKGLMCGFCKYECQYKADRR